MENARYERVFYGFAKKLAENGQAFIDRNTYDPDTKSVMIFYSDDDSTDRLEKQIEYTNTLEDSIEKLHSDIEILNSQIKTLKAQNAAFKSANTKIKKESNSNYDKLMFTFDTLEKIQKMCSENEFVKSKMIYDEIVEFSRNMMNRFM